MKVSKKIISIVLAVALVLSVFTLAVSAAYTKGAESSEANTINYKYEVAKVESCSMADGSGTYTGDDIYAVSMFIKAKNAVSYVTFPIHYNNAHFAPVTLIDGTDPYYGEDTWMDGSYYGAMGEGTIYAYALDGDYTKNTGMYKADGSAASTKALAKCIGLGNANATAMSITTEFVGQDHPNAAKWQAGLPANTGVMYFNIDDAAIAKQAYLNNIDGIGFSTDWVKIATVFFLRLPGVTDDDCIGDEFGVLTNDAFGPDGVLDLYGQGYFVGASSTVTKAADINIVSNAVVEGDATPIIKAAKRGDAVKTYVGWGAYNVGTDSCDGRFVDDGTGKASWNIAVEATFNAADIAAAGLTFTNGQCNEIDKLEATVKIGDSAAVTKSTQFIYGNKDGQGNYVYLVVITGIVNGAADDVEVEFGGTLAGGGKIPGEKVTFNLATEFAAAQGRTLPADPTAA